MVLFHKQEFNAPQAEYSQGKASEKRLSHQEEEMLCPRYVLKIIGKYSQRSTIKLVHTVDSLVSYIMGSLS